MNDVTTIDRQHDPALCPSWCNGGHPPPQLTEGFHHDQASLYVTPAGSEGMGSEFLAVKLSQFVSPQNGAHPVFVEVQNEQRTIALLQPAAARDLAAALIRCAATADGNGVS